MSERELWDLVQNARELLRSTIEADVDEADRLLVEIQCELLGNDESIRLWDERRAVPVVREQTDE